MLDLTEKQMTLLSSVFKDITWTFTVTTVSETTYRWGNKAFTYYPYDWGSGNDNLQDGYELENEVFEYKGLVFDFKSINRSRSEINIQVPDELVFSIPNKDNALDSSDFDSAIVLLSLHISNGLLSDKIVTWKLNVKRCSPIQQTLQFTCVDFITQLLDGNYGELIQDLFAPNEEDTDSGFCIPATYGTCYIPLSMPYIEDQRYVLLGKADATYNIEKIKAPEECGGSVWPQEDTTTHFVQSTMSTNGVDYIVFIPLIAKHTLHTDGLYHTGLSTASSLICSDASWATDILINHYITNDTDGSYGKILSNTPVKIVATLVSGTDNDWDNNDEFTIWAKDPVWKSANNMILNPRVMFSKSTTVNLTNPAYVVEDFLKKCSTQATDIKDSTFVACAASFDDWGLRFRGALYYSQKKEDVVSNLLTMCHSKLVAVEQVEIHILRKASVATIDSSVVLRKSEFGETTFKASYFDADKIDSGYVAFQEWDKPQDSFFKILVSAKNNAEFQKNGVLEVPFVQDSIQVQKIGSLAFQRSLLKDCNLSHKAKGNLLYLQPDDVVTIYGKNYGATVSYKAMIDTAKINKDATLEFSYTRFKNTLDDWDDLSFNVVNTAATEVSTSAWRPVISGPASNLTGNNIPNQIFGNMRVGSTNSYINFDSDVPNMALYDENLLRFLVGDLDNDNTNYGMRGLDSDGNTLLEVSTKQNTQPFVSGYPDHKAMELEMMKLNFQHISWAQFAIYDAFDDEIKRRNPDIGPYDARVYRSMLDNGNDTAADREFIFTSKTYNNITTVETGTTTANGSGFIRDTSKSWFTDECKNLTLVDQSLVEFNVDSCSGSTLFFTGVPAAGIYSLKDDNPQYTVGFLTYGDSSNGSSGNIRFEVSFDNGNNYQTLYATGSTNLLNATVSIDNPGVNYIAKLSLINNGSGNGPKVYNYLLCTDPSSWRF